MINDKDIYYLPAEWEKQSGVQLTWPHKKTDWNYCLPQITKTFIEITSAIAKFEKVIIAAQYPEDVSKVLYENIDKNLFDNIKIIACNSNDTWARDHAPLTLIKKNNAKKTPILLNFKFNGWGEKFEANLDNKITETLYINNIYNAELKNHDNFVLEGGSIESDGQGTILTTTSCLMAKNRNQPLTKEQIDEYLQKFFHAKRIIWLDHGLLIGDDTDGHIDTIARFAPNDTILYVKCYDENNYMFEDFQKLEQQLMTLRTLNNKPYKLIPLPMPDNIYYNNEQLPATYANFLIINNAVVCPTYNQPEKDKQALDSISNAFPEREIIAIDSRIIVQQHGSIHCLTMQYPESVITNNEQK